LWCIVLMALEFIELLNMQGFSFADTYTQVWALEKKGA
jgi:hypothetical protein